MTGKKFFNLDIPGSQYAVAKRKKNVSATIFPDYGLISNWIPPQFFISPNSGLISDYMFSNIGGRLCSEKLKAIIEAHKGENDIIQWLPVDIYDEESGTTLRYYHIHFPETFDCLSEKYCKRLPDKSLVAPFYSYKKIKTKQIFNCPEGYETIITIFSENMKKAIEAAGCTGLDLDKANVIYDEEEPIQAVS